MAYEEITDGEIAPGQPLTSALAFKIRDNPIAISQNDPLVAAAVLGNFVSRMAVYDEGNQTPGVSFNVIIPAGVHRIFYILQGGGGAGQRATGSTGASALGSGGITSLSLNGHSNDAFNPRVEGGFGGGRTDTAGRDAQQFDCLGGIPGAHDGHRPDGRGSDSVFGNGGVVDTAPYVQSRGAGGGASLDTRVGGGAGAVGYGVMTVTPGDTLACEIGIGGDATVMLGTGAFGADGAAGLIILCY